ncbi:histidinol dehydrogenase [Mycolicibacterium litorale]|uniref:Histidinol dehydrogenase n=1 Tax=Mycolicibacterium litorale TaxID=758802 RepID=A0A6S6P877_9MYCO|nr:histidinol dehydrogenase [Mycolicibacterium litorale]BCI56083.1 histidinol dehydrogenase [Mycolicibacterium litorale]
MTTAAAARSDIATTDLKLPQRESVERGSTASVRSTVESVIEDIRTRGDAAVREYSEKFDKYSAESYLLTPEKIEEIMARVPRQVIEDIRFVQEQVRVMAQKQLESLSDFEIETLPGVFLGQKNVPIQAAGAYIPGGKYPLLASAHMTIVTAKVAGVKRVAACTPLIRGEVPDATIAAMHLAGADEIYLLGGIQAVAAMAVGTETIRPVNMLAGPGNAFVAEAKRQLFGEVGIDLFAGPTEVLIVADEHADPFIVAVDLLSQAEHGPDSPAVLITTSEELGRKVIEHIDTILVDMPTRDFAEPAWRDWGEVRVVETLDEAYALADQYASEHVQILTENPREALDKMHDYGALFLGEGTCVSYGDKVIGTNHVLPTRGAARYTGGLWVGKYLRTVTYQEVTNTESSAFFGELCGRAARVELFEGHARSGDVRAAKYRGEKLPWSDHEFTG